MWDQSQESLPDRERPWVVGKIQNHGGTHSWCSQNPGPNSHSTLMGPGGGVGVGGQGQRDSHREPVFREDISPACPRGAAEPG